MNKSIIIIVIFAAFVGIVSLLINTQKHDFSEQPAETPTEAKTEVVSPEVDVSKTTHTAVPAEYLESLTIDPSLKHSDYPWIISKWYNQHPTNKDYKSYFADGTIEVGANEKRQNTCKWFPEALDRVRVECVIKDEKRGDTHISYRFEANEEKDLLTNLDRVGSLYQKANE